MKKIDKDLLNKKEELIANATKVLKQEFVGIDEQIDGVMDNLRTWFLFPELQVRPLVICLWGMTGVGKTSLINRVAQLLDIEQDEVYFNFAEIGECSSWEIEDRIENELANERSNRLFVYDEFQYAATLDKLGDEKDKKSGLKPFWELLDTGKIHKRDDFWQVRQIFNVASYMIRINSRCPMLIENGKWINAKECLVSFTEHDISKFREVFTWDMPDDGKKIKSLRAQYEDGTESDVPTFDKSSRQGEFFIKDFYVDRLLNLWDKADSVIRDHMDAYNELLKMNYDEILDVLEKVYKNSSKGYDLNFRDSVIFVLGNLDEAYEMALSVDPDMSPDQFYKATKKITIVDIKKALQERFRNEQIARLGNIHLIYPSFSSDSFRKIISMTLDGYANSVKREIGLNMVFKKSLHDIIYKESVFPTHGTRPIFSTIHEIVKTKLPYIIQAIYDGGFDDADTVEFGFKSKKSVITVRSSDGTELFTKQFKEKLRVEGLRSATKDEEQSLVALHESGHFVVYANIYGKMPEKLCSKTTSKDTAGFLLRNPDDDEEKLLSKEGLINDIKIALGGYVAERIVFGDYARSAGASSDLRKATAIASRMVRTYGMYMNTAVTTYYTDPQISMAGHIIKEYDDTYINKKIHEIINNCADSVEEILNNPEWRKMLKESALYLSTHSTMPKKKMLECYQLVDENVRKLPDRSTYYRDKINEI